MADTDDVRAARAARAADASKRYRKRFKDGIYLVKVEIDHATLEGLLSNRLITPDKLGDQLALSEAITKFLATNLH